MIPVQTVANPTATCKCCGSVAKLFGVVDFNKNCEIVRKQVLEMSGIPIFYHRCASCGFVFTVAFDDWTQEQFLAHIYNAEYALVDPEYLDHRPNNNGELMNELLRGNRSLRILDYGGGNGQWVAQMKKLGYTDVVCYDPFVKAFAQRPEGLFDCIVCWEVIEHSNKPAEIVRDIGSFLKDPGAVVFSTLMNPYVYAVDYWYVAPRNGHLSIFSKEAFRALIDPMGLEFASFNPNVHVLYRQMPEYVKPWFGANLPK